MTGEGVKEFFEAVDKARTEYETYVPLRFCPPQHTHCRGRFVLFRFSSLSRLEVSTNLNTSGL